MEEGEVIVIDNGSGVIKAGWSGEDAPRVVIPSILLDTHSQPLPAATLRSSESKEFLVGHDALVALNAAAQSGGVAVSAPMERDEVEDWKTMERVWEHIFTQQLKVDNTEDYAVLITVPPSASRKSRDKIAELMFRYFKVSSLCIANACVLSLFSTGRTTGVVVECGEGVSYAVPVFEGYALPHAVRQLNLAGKDVTSYLMNIFRQKGIDFSSSRRDLLRDIKEKMCAVASSPFVGPSKFAPLQTKLDDVNTYELPDGSIITVDDECRFCPPEALFAPGLLGVEGQGIHQLAHESVQSCDAYLRPRLYENIVLAGGTTMMSGFAERMKTEMDRLSNQPETVQVVQDSQRKHAAWIGGSMYASLPTFNQIKITRQEYLEGDNVVHKKYF